MGLADAGEEGRERACESKNDWESKRTSAVVRLSVIVIASMSVIVKGGGHHKWWTGWRQCTCTRVRCVATSIACSLTSASFPAVTAVTPAVCVSISISVCVSVCISVCVSVSDCDCCAGGVGVGVGSSCKDTDTHRQPLRVSWVGQKSGSGVHVSANTWRWASPRLLSAPARSYHPAEPPAAMLPPQRMVAKQRSRVSQ